MRKKTVLISLFLAAVLLAGAGCGIIEGQNYTLYRYIDTVYSLAPQEIIDVYNNINMAQAAMNVSTIMLPCTYEVKSVINYSYTEFVPGSGGTTLVKISGSVTKTATAFMINDSGYILTNAHVITLDNADQLTDLKYEGWEIKVNLTESDARFDATVVAYDTFLDIAVLKVDPRQVNTATLGYAVFFNLDDPTGPEKPSIELYYGEPVISLGNAYGRGVSVTQGIVSAPKKYFTNGIKVTTAIQVDAAINNGSSGGPLCNAYARILGMNTYKLNIPGADDIGYAIPTYVILDYINDLNSGKSDGVVLDPSPRIKYYYTNLREYAQTNIYSNFSQ